MVARQLKTALVLLVVVLLIRWLAAGCAQRQRDRVGAAKDGVFTAVEEYCSATGAVSAWLGTGGEAPVGITILCPAGAQHLADELEPTPEARSARGGI